MSTTLERRSRLFKDRAALKNHAGKAVLGPALQGTTATMPTLSGSAPATWKTGLTAPQIAALNNLWAAVYTLRVQVTGSNLHYQPSTLTSVEGDFNSVISDLGSYLPACREDYVRKDIQLTKGIRLKNPLGLEVCGGSLMQITEGGDPPLEDGDYMAVDFVALFGVSNEITINLTALSVIADEQLRALADNRLLQTA